MSDNKIEIVRDSELEDFTMSVYLDWEEYTKKKAEVDDAINKFIYHLGTIVDNMEVQE